MYLAVDIGGTKTLLASFDAQGKVLEKLKFPTPVEYDEFVTELAANISRLDVDDYRAGCVASPGRINRAEGIGLDYGNLPWHDVSIGPDLEKIINAPVVVENDAKLAGLSEALLIKEEFNRVLYMTVSTGIGMGVITDGHIDPDFLNLEGGQILLEHHGKVQKWESFASGSAIKKTYGKLASEINDKETWRTISRNLALGLIDVLAIIQPDVVVVGGGVGAHFKKFRAPLMAELRKFETPLVPVPPIRQAERSEEAVIYGCYELAKEKYPVHS
jgi:predicted NBD/HSP70 family sugar kinase